MLSLINPNDTVARMLDSICDVTKFILKLQFGVEKLRSCHQSEHLLKQVIAIIICLSHFSDENWILSC